MIEQISQKELILLNKCIKRTWYLSFLVLFRQKFKYELYLYNGCHDLTQKVVNFNDVTIVFVKGSNNGIDFWHMNKDDVIHITKNSNLNEKSGLL